MTRDQRIVFVLASLFICAYFLLFAGAGFQAYFHFDDLRNLYWAWTTPVEDLLKANLLFFLPFLPAPGRFVLSFHFLDRRLQSTAVSDALLCHPDSESLSSLPVPPAPNGLL